MQDGKELLRTELMSRLMSKYGYEESQQIIDMFDLATEFYTITKKPMDIIVYDGIPEAVKDYLVSKSIANLSMNSLFQYKFALEKFFNTVRMKLEDITANDIRKYLINYKMNRNVSDRYLENIRREIHAFMDWAVRNSYIAKNPCDTVEHIKYKEVERVPFTNYELEVIRWNCKNIREKAIVDFFFSTGCRLSEMVDLNKSDIDFTKRSVSIKHGKGDKARIVYFNAEAELSLRKYLESRTDDEEALFVKSVKPHTRLKQRGIEDIIRNIGKRSGLHAFPHKLRHTFATESINGGMPLEMLQKLMGHVNPRTTLIYAKLYSDRLMQEHQKVFS